MARTVISKTIVEKAPSHDGKPCYAAWTFRHYTPGAEADPQRLEEKRPKWSIQIYDTTPPAADPEHVAAMAKKIHEDTLEGRDISSSGARDRIEVHGFPLPVDMPEEERVEACVRRHKAEVAARHEARRADFFIPVMMYRPWRRRFIIIDQVRDAWELDQEDGCFLDVNYDRLPFTPDPDHPPPANLPDAEHERFSHRNLCWILHANREFAGAFYENYGMRILEDWDEYK